MLKSSARLIIIMTQFTPYEILLCLYDKKRTERFKKAINSVVKPGDICIDAGSGTGILALFAAKAGAKKVYAIEQNPRFIHVIKENAKRNGFEKIIKVIKADATKIKFPGKADIIISELMSTGLFFEPQMQVFDNLRKFLKKDGQMIPERFYSSLELVNADEKMYGFKMNYDSRFIKLKEKSMSYKKIYDIVFFTKKEPIELKQKIKVKTKKSGIVNAIRITSRVMLAKSIYLGESDFMLNNEIIFLKKPVRVAKNKIYKIFIKYRGGQDIQKANFSVS